jgi:hypothetical protein
MSKKMTTMGALALVWACAFSGCQAERSLEGYSGRDFRSLWYDGNAEISSYRIELERYGEMRRGTRVMIVVTEPLRRSTRIKPDVALPELQKLEVIKLNDTVTFQTGIYPYSVMTSVFQSVAASEGYAAGTLVKQTVTVQEYCGQVYEQLYRKDGQFRQSLYSYFESEGEGSEAFPEEDGPIYSEDQFWMLLRNLDREFVALNQSRTLKAVPSAWLRRKAHVQPHVVDSTLTLETGEKMRWGGRYVATRVARWDLEGRWVRLDLEADYPHRILKYETSSGEKGELLGTLRLPYWKLNRLRDEHYLKKLGLKR